MEFCAPVPLNWAARECKAQKGFRIYNRCASKSRAGICLFPGPGNAFSYLVSFYRTAAAGDDYNEERIKYCRSAGGSFTRQEDPGSGELNSSVAVQCSSRLVKCVHYCHQLRDSRDMDACKSNCNDESFKCMNLEHAHRVGKGHFLVRVLYKLPPLGRGICVAVERTAAVHQRYAFCTDHAEISPMLLASAGGAGLWCLISDGKEASIADKALCE